MRIRDCRVIVRMVDMRGTTTVTRLNIAYKRRNRLGHRRRRGDGDVQTFGVGELSYVVVTGNIALVYDSDKIAQVFICLPRPLLTCFPLRQGVKIGGKATKTTITN